MLRALGSTADQINSAEPVSALPPRIRDQMDENAALVEDLDKREEAFAAVKRAADDVISKAGNRADPAVRGRDLSNNNESKVEHLSVMKPVRSSLSFELSFIHFTFSSHLHLGLPVYVIH
jgi:hypothetical protein